MYRRSILVAAVVLCFLTTTSARAAGDPPPNPPSMEPAAVPAPTAGPVTQNVTNNNILQLPSMPTPAELAGQVFQSSLALMLGTLADQLQKVVSTIASGHGNFITQTPPEYSYDNGHVVTLAASVRAAALASLALVIGCGGLWIATGRRLGIVHSDPLELLVRAAVGAVLISISMELCHWMIDLNNALASGVGGALPSWEQPVPPTPVLSDVLARTAYLLTALVLLLQMAMRLVLVDICIILAPAAWVLWILPQTHGLFSRWLGTFVGAVYVQFLQVLALKLGIALVADLGGGLTSTILGIAVLLFTLKIPAIVQAGYHSNGLASALMLASAGTTVARTGFGMVSGGAGLAAGGAAMLMGAQRQVSNMPTVSGGGTPSRGSSPAPTTAPPTLPTPPAPRPSTYESRVES